MLFVLGTEKEKKIVTLSSLYIQLREQANFKTFFFTEKLTSFFRENMYCSYSLRKKRSQKEKKKSEHEKMFCVTQGMYIY